MFKIRKHIKWGVILAALAALIPIVSFSENPLEIQLPDGVGSDAIRVSVPDSRRKHGTWKLEVSHDLRDWGFVGIMRKGERDFSLEVSSTYLDRPSYFRAVRRGTSDVQVRSANAPDSGTPRGMKTAAGDILVPLLPTGDSQADQKIQKAIDRINVSLSPQYWFNDSFAADSADGKKVFDREHQAVIALENALPLLADEESVADVLEAISLLVNADRILAVNTLELAIRSGGNPGDIATAEAELSSGDEKVLARNFSGAIIDYKKAWDFAGKAIQGINRFPIGVDDTATTDEDTAIPNVSVLGNDFDLDGDLLSVSNIDDSSTAGRVDLTAGIISYDPEDRFQSLAVGETASDSFGYEISDGNGGTDTATVEVTISGVNDAPVAIDQEVSTNGSPVTISLIGDDVDSGDTLSFAVTTLPGSGTLTDSEGGAIVLGGPLPDNEVIYDPGANDDFDVFDFEVSDGNGSSDTGTVTVNEAANPNPEPEDDPQGITDVQAIAGLDVETTVDVPVLVKLEGQGPAGTPDLSFSIVGPGPSLGTLSAIIPQDPDNPADPILTAVVTYTPNLGVTGTDTFDFEVTDGMTTASATKTIQIDAEAVPTPPQEGKLTVGQLPDTVVAINLQDRRAERIDVPELRALVTSGAAIAGNVSDANGDGFGDGKDNLPGPAPVLIAAGVDVNLGTNPSGSVTDPAGDATNSSSDDPADPDLLSATVSSDGTNLTFLIRFVAAGFDASTSRGSFVLDTDEDIATGFPGIDSANNDDDLMGIEFLVNIGANLGANATVEKFVSLPNNFTNVGTFAATVLSDGYSVTIPLSTFDGDDGKLTYKCTTQSHLPPGSGFTGILDYMPDLGLAPSESKVSGIQGTARINIEWDISTLDPDHIETADVVLNTKKGTVDLLDTFWHHVLADGDGLLSESDYEAAPVEPSPLAVMPVIAGPTGTEGTFRFDVAAELRASVAAGFDFFVIQGRVDESLTGGGFQRGLQIRSTANGNLGGSLEPQLEVTEPDAPLETFTILSLPVNGTLKDSSGVTITTVPTVLTDQMVTFTPAAGLSFTTSFDYRIDNVMGSALGEIILRYGNGCDIDAANCDDGRP